MPKTHWQVWELDEEDGRTLTLVHSDRKDDFNKWEPGAKQLYSIPEQSYSNARQAHFDIQGWGEYKQS